MISQKDTIAIKHIFYERHLYKKFLLLIDRRLTNTQMIKLMDGVRFL